LSSYWSNMTGIVKDAAGEQSGIYKAMYLAQQSFAIASATINAFQAYNQILASPWYLDVISKQTAATLVLGMGMANVGMIAGQTIAGMAHNGIDNIPREGTWLLDGGERVLNPQQNKDLTNYLNNRQNGSSEGNVQISQQITFADGSASVNTQGQKQIAESLNNAMNDWARRESRQGGVLFNLVRR
ncbi:replication protein, partial [Acinetobacter baumannii]